ncbi:hypothetical protein M405DRAFT_805619 [Rhizopogon salebrosus TDB-379]|nr:hypothetical protein M405DRAFT_805619 [Rhizopogon salebrosus TDB-379]
MGARWVQPELVVALLFGSPFTTPFFIIGITHHASTVRHISWQQRTALTRVLCSAASTHGSSRWGHEQHGLMKMLRCRVVLTSALTPTTTGF